MQIFGSGKRFSSKRPSSTLSSNFKTISRDKKATWGNRFIRDHNDLVYDTDAHSISKKIKSGMKQKEKKNKVEEEPSATTPYEYSPVKQRQMPKTSQSLRNINAGLQASNYISSMHDYQQKMRKGQETAASTAKKRRYKEDIDNVEIQPFNDYYDEKGKERNSGIREQFEESQEYWSAQPKLHLNSLGLSKFQYEKTIEGRMITKSNHHINFNKHRTNKINNVNKIWYNNSKDLQKIQMLEENENKTKMKKTHPFRSYSSHKLFFRTKRMYDDNGCGNGGMLDKMYDYYSPEKYDVNHERIGRTSVNYELMTERPGIPKRPGTNLDYKVQLINTLSLGDSKRPVMEMSQSARNLVFSRQVISPKRGCFR